MITTTENLWTSLHDYIRGFVEKNVRDKHTANDIVQDIFLKIQLNIESVRDETKLTSWIFKIARNTINDHFRKLQRSSEVDISTTSLVNEETIGDDHLSNCVKHFINEMPEKYRQAIQLSEMEGMSQLELAEKLNISYSGAKSRVQRGRQKLKELILQCCDVQADRYGNIIDYQNRQCKGRCD